MATAQKREFREEAERRIARLSAAEHAAKSEAACRRLLELSEVEAAHTIAFYASLDDEIDVWPAVHTLAEEGKRILLPRCIPETRQMACVEIVDFEDQLAEGTFGILEPAMGRVVEVHEADVVVTPGRAFDPACNRVGRGVGYYDRFFLTPGFRAFKCAVAFECQVFDAVPFDRNDVPVDVIVTESRVLWNHRSG